MREDFLEEAGHGVRLLKEAMDRLPHVYFNMKDREGRIMAINPANCKLCNIRCELDAIGMTSTDLFPGVLAKAYQSKDRSVLKSGKPLTDVFEDHPADLSSTMQISNRYPIRNANNEIIGTCCVYYRCPGKSGPTDWQQRLQTVVSHIEAHYAEGLNTPQLAEIIHTSPTTFHRQFTQILGVTPNEYITTIRINAAMKLLEETNRLLSDIALAVGFYDQSHFTRSFKKARGITPGEYRRKHRS